MRSLFHAIALFSLGATLLAAGPSCSGCSEECSDQNQGSEGCGCSSDQDCTTRLGEVLLCKDGACTPGDPPDAAAKACDRDADCSDGELCGLGLCSPAPACQRIDVATLRVRELDNGVQMSPIFDATIERDACSHEVASNVADFNMGVISPTTGSIDATGDCSAGTWFAASRAGVLSCGTAVVVLSVEEPCFIGGINACAAGTCTSLGSELDEDAGVCR